MREKVRKEVEEGRVSGAHLTLTLPTLCISPLGIVPKNAPGEFRLNHHLSYPKGHLVNDAINTALCTSMLLLKQ